MAYTEQDMQKQMEQFAALRDEFSRLEAQEKALRRQAGLPEEGGEKMDMAKLSPEERRHVEEAMAEAGRAGEARAAQSRPARTASGPLPGAGRRGVVRLYPCLICVARITDEYAG